MTRSSVAQANPQEHLAPKFHLGFRHRHAASLIGEFYPDGMPEDWRHSYLVMMTQAIWVDDRDEDLVEILAAIVDAPQPVLTVWATDEPTRANLWQAAHPEQPLIILSANSPIWSVQTASNVGARVALVPKSDQPAQIRRWIEQFTQQTPAGPCALFVEGEAPSVPTFDRLKTLIDLMGL